ncbi:unnamed protein product [Cylicocyclus nassatus]|uniref:Uncharacterized protein n=1 Tax=Cylicocyclus nassatus TaxID=53992 RepID=A0AA36M510_CYLNA|nr:unnamed protein product [Cylicocyclus nassatus]
MRPVKSKTLLLTEELVKERQQLIGVIYGLGIALDEYFTVQNLCKEYDTLYTIPLVTKLKQLGYNSVDEMLMSSGCFVTAVLESKKHYRADPQRGSNATQKNSSLFKRQVKKKKAKTPKIDTPTRRYFHRANSRPHSFLCRPTAFAAGLIQNQKTTLPKVPQKSLECLSVEPKSLPVSSGEHLTMPKFCSRLIEIILDRKHDLVNLSTISELYEERYAVEFTTNEYLIQEQVLAKSRSTGYIDCSGSRTTIYVDSGGYLHLNREEVNDKRTVTAEPVQASLKADIGNDMSESPTSSSSECYVGNSEAADCAYFPVTDAGSKTRRDLTRIKEEPLDQAFNCYLKLNRSCYERIGTAEDDLSDLSDAESLQDLCEMQITVAENSQPSGKAVNVNENEQYCFHHQPSEGNPNSTLPFGCTPSSVFTMSNSSGSRKKLGKEFASIGKFFQKTASKKNYKNASKKPTFESKSSAMRPLNDGMNGEMSVSIKTSRFTW